MTNDIPPINPEEQRKEYLHEMIREAEELGLYDVDEFPLDSTREI